MIRLEIGDCREVLKTLPDNSVHCCVTSPPYYGLRDYGVDGQIGLEQTPEEYVSELVQVFREVKRVLRDDGTLWLNLGDSYVGGAKKGEHEGKKQKTNRGATWGDNDKLATLKSHISGLKNKDLIGIPWRMAFALQADGWYLRSDIIWNKPSCMPESVTDRPTKAHEYIFLLSKSAKYYYDNEAIKEPTLTKNNSNRNRDETKLNNTPGRSRMKGLKTNSYDFKNKRSVWTISTKPYSGAHFATFPPALIEPCIRAGCPEHGTVLDPFGGSGTVGEVCNKLNRNAILIELNPEYKSLILERTNQSLACFEVV